MSLDKILRKYYLLKINLKKTSLSAEDQFLVDKIAECLISFDFKHPALHDDNESDVFLNIYLLNNSWCFYPDKITMNGSPLFENSPLTRNIFKLAKSSYHYFNQHQETIAFSKKYNDLLQHYSYLNPATPKAINNKKYSRLFNALKLFNVMESKETSQLLERLALNIINDQFLIGITPPEDDIELSKKTIYFYLKAPPTDSNPHWGIRHVAEKARSISETPITLNPYILLFNQEPIVAKTNGIRILFKILHKKYLENKELALAAHRKKIIEAGSLGVQWSARQIGQAIENPPDKIKKNKI